MRADARPLPPFEIAIGAADRAAPLREALAAGIEAQRTAAHAPFEPGIGEHLVEPLRLRLALDGERAGYDQRRPDGGGDLASAHDRGGTAQVGNPAVGATADKGGIDRRSGKRGARFEPDIGMRALRPLRHAPIDRDGLFGAGAPAHHRRNCRSVERDLAVEHRAGIAAQRLPIGCVEGVGGVSPPGEPGKGLCIGRDEAAHRAELGRHVAQRHAPFHVERCDRLAGEFDRMACPAARAMRSDQVQRHVLGRHAR